ncbi:hypothetical protein ACFW1A_21460 [Kitasatospora sp. NPDC058965]|uniref:hypothetical protein n=1 Tax=Kitasatospora sp. NPDC058965 TaxID=3346682 RepID=UPI0036930D3F
MGWYGMWGLLPVRPETVERYGPLLRSAIDEERQLPASRELLREWHARGSGRWACDAFTEAAGPGALDGRIEVVYEAWEAGRDDGEPRVVVLCRKAFPAAALAYAMGPQRFSLLPGWFGDLVLTPAQVRASLPRVERAFTWTAAERADAERLLTEALRGDPDRADLDALLDGVPPVWRAAARGGFGLLGAQLLPS